MFSVLQRPVEMFCSPSNLPHISLTPPRQGNQCYNTYKITMRHLLADRTRRDVVKGAKPGLKCTGVKLLNFVTQHTKCPNMVQILSCFPGVCPPPAQESRRLFISISACFVQESSSQSTKTKRLLFFLQLPVLFTNIYLP